MTAGTSKQQIIHFDFIALAPGTSDEAVEELIAETAALSSLESVDAVGVIRSSGDEASDFDLAFFFVLDGFTSLEPFGTNEGYIRFLQGRVARMLRAFAGADVVLREPFPTVGPYAACLALAAPDETYDWEVWAALEGWEAGLPAVIGLAVGERQRYRGCVLRFSDSPVSASRPADDRFGTSLVTGATQRL